MNYTYEETLYHHGILGQKWGIRRFQNKDGSYTAEGKARRREDSASEIPSKKISKQTIKKVAIGAAALGTVAAAAVFVKKNPVAIARVIMKASDLSVNGLSNSSIKKGSSFVKKAIKTGASQVVKGIADGVSEAPYKVAKAAASGAAIIAANKMVEKLIGEEKNSDYIQAYNAYNRKNKIGRLPDKKTKSDEEDDD